jgi:L-aminopeptidase/D-esterase-like protein
MVNNTLTAIEGIRVGHESDFEGGTGVTVIIFDRPAIGSADISGMATSTRQIDSLEIMHPGTSIHALCLSGGSAFGLDAAGGVVKYLEDKGIGLDLSVAKLPVVPTAVIYDLSFMSAKSRPTKDMAFKACMNASGSPVKQGTIGAGTGATCGKLRGVLNATKTGLGSSCIKGFNGVRMGALVIANPFGDIINDHGEIIAGARNDKGFLDTRKAIASGENRSRIGSPSNTTLCVLVTDAYLDKISALQVARMAGNGLSRHISPFNTPFDGDIVFCLSVGDKEAHPLHLGVIGARAAEEALINAVMKAGSLGGLPVHKDIVK